MAVQAMSAILTQMTSMAHATQQTTSAATTPAVDFSTMLEHSIRHLNHIQTAAINKAQNFELGTPGITLNDTMIDMQKSTLALNIGVQVRNKLVAAYQDIMQMQI